MENTLNERLNGSAPRIALPEPTSTNPAYNQRAWAPYFHSLTSSGAVGVPIPLDASAATVDRRVGSCSGVLLPGSPADVDPRKYGAVAVPECALADVARETVDERLLRHAFETGKPVFGICFGLQSLNVWRKGSLIQHLPPQTSVNHDPGPAVLSAHGVRVVAGSRLAGTIGAVGALDDLVSITGSGAVVVNSSHHQAVDLVGEGLTIGARCPEDGVIEALEGTAADHFVLAVQWHPERSFDTSAVSRRLFRAFVDAAVAWQSRLAVESLAS
jgi:putative glutamine amidotransferase